MATDQQTLKKCTFYQAVGELDQYTGVFLARGPLAEALSVEGDRCQAG